MQSSHWFKIMSRLVVALFVPLGLSACQQTNGNSEGSEKATTAAPSITAGAETEPKLTAYAPGAYTPLITCNLGMVNATNFGSQPVALKTEHANAFKGWLFASGLAAPEYWLRFDDQHAGSYLHTPLQLSIERPDVVAAHPEAPRDSGFAVTIPANALPAGHYHAYIAVNSGGTTYICDSGRYVDVKN